MLNVPYLSTHKIGSGGWIEYTYNSNPKQLAEFNVSLKPINYAVDMDFHTASKQVVEELANMNDNIYVAMSGGIDSEHVANSFYENKIKFTPAIFTCDDLNELDVWWAYEWCREHNITPITVNYTVKQLTSRLSENSIKYRTRPQCGPLAVQVLSELARNNHGILVAGTGDFTHYPDTSMAHMRHHDKPTFSYSDYRVDKEGYYIHLPDLVSGIINSDMPFNFFSWNPQILYSYINEYDVTKDSAANKVKITGCSKRPKYIGYPDYFFRTDRDIVSLNNRMGFRYNRFTEVDYLGTREELLRVLSKGE